MELLNELQHQQLIDSLKAGHPVWNISGWLMRECGLSVQQAMQVRHEAEESLKPPVSPKVVPPVDVKVPKESVPEGAVPEENVSGLPILEDRYWEEEPEMPADIPF